MSLQQRQLALFRAAEEGRRDVLAVLLASGVDKDAVSNGGWTAIVFASLYGKDEILRMLIDAGADMRVRDGDGQWLLHMAAVGSNVGCAKILLEAGADVGARDSVGGTALHCATVTGGVEFVRLLVDAGAEPEARDTEGCTPLQIAIRAANLDGEEDDDVKMRIECAAFLASLGADPAPHPTDPTVRMPAAVAAAARACLAAMQPAAVADVTRTCLAAMQPDAVAESFAEVAAGMQQAAAAVQETPIAPAAVAVKDAPIAVVAFIRAQAASMRAEEAFRLQGDPLRLVCSAEDAGGLFRQTRERVQAGIRPPQWGQPEMMAVLAIARRVALEEARTEARAALAAASEALDVARERQRQFVAALPA